MKTTLTQTQNRIGRPVIQLEFPKRPFTAVQLANEQKVSRPLVFKRVAEMVAAGQLQEVGKEKVVRGRPSTLYKLIDKAVGYKNSPAPKAPKATRQRRTAADREWEAAVEEVKATLMKYGSLNPELAKQKAQEIVSTRRQKAHEEEIKQLPEDIREALLAK